MSPNELAELESLLTADELAELHDLITQDINDKLWSPLPGPQTMAYESQADIIGFGGAAGGGKTDLAIGKALMQHRVAFVVRKNGTEHTGMVDRLTELLGTRDGFSSKDGIWRAAGPREVQIEFGSLPNPKDEEKYRGRPHDLIIYDEATSLMQLQVEFLMAWNRTTTPGQKCQTLLTFNPPSTAEGRWVIEYFAPWLDKKHPNPAQPGELRWMAMVDGIVLERPDGVPFLHKGELITPKSRTFIPSRITDNPYLTGTNYMSTLQALPEPLRSQMLYGDFQAGVQDDPWQIIPTAWCEEAMARWKPRRPKGEMLSMGVDVARGGQDNTTIATRHMDESGKGMWFDEPSEHKGSETPNGAKVAGLTIGDRRDDAPIHIDVIGVGASPYDILNGMGLNVLGINVSEKARGTDKSGKLRFFNQRSELWWKMREALDPGNDTGIALPPSKKLLAELCAPKWEASGYTVKVESRDDIIKRIGRSPDMATAYILALIETPKISKLQRQQSMQDVLSYDPMYREQ
jgi:hypothetical protein